MARKYITKVHENYIDDIHIPSRTKVLDFFLDKSDKDYRDHLQQAIFSLGWAEKVVVTITKYSEKRSVQRNKYYWKVIVSYYAEEIGLDSLDVHDMFKKEILPLFMTDEQIAEGDFSTTVLSDNQFDKYCEHLVDIARKFYGMKLPQRDQIRR